MTQKLVSEDPYPSIHYIQVKEICYLNDVKKTSKKLDEYELSIQNSTFSSISQMLYKKVLQSRQQKQVPSKKKQKKKNQSMYDLQDKWINDEQAYTQPEMERTNSSQFQHYKALSGVGIEELYESKFKKSTPKSPTKNDKSRAVVNPKLSVNELFKSNHLTGAKYDELKKKIQMSLKTSSTFKMIQKRQS